MLGDKEETATQAECKFTCAVTTGTMFKSLKVLNKQGDYTTFWTKPSKSRIQFASYNGREHATEALYN